MQIGVTAAGSAGTVFAVDDANLAKSEVLANQMIEFMKYRAPANFVADLLSSIQWLTTMKTNLEMIRAKVAYLNKVTDVINEASALLAKIDQILTAFKGLVAAADVLMTLEAQDPIATIYADTLTQVLIDLDGAPDTALSPDEEKVLDERLKKAHDAILNLQDAANAVKTSVSDFSTKPLRDAINGLTSEADTYESATTAHEAATSPSDVDVVSSRKELTTLQETIASISSSLESASDAFIVEVQDIADAFVDNALSAAKVSAADFAKWDTYDGVAKFVGGYVDRILANAKVSTEDAVGQLRGALDSAIKSVVDSLGEKITKAVTDRIESVLQEIRAALSKSAGEIVGEETKVSISTFFSTMNDQLQKYKDLMAALTEQHASPHLKAGDGSGKNGPEPGSINNKDDLASDTGSLLDSINVLLGGLKSAMGRVVDSILIAEYVVEIGRAHV